MQRLQPTLSRLNIPLLVFFSGLGFTVLTAYFASSGVLMGATYHFEHLQAELSDSIDSRIRVDINLLSQMRGLIQLDPKIDRSLFKIYTDNINLAEGYPGVAGLGYVQAVLPKEQKAFENKIRHDYQNSGLKIWPSDWIKSAPADDPAYVVRFYELQPSTSLKQDASQVTGSGLSVIGYEGHVDPRRRDVFERALKTGKAALSLPHQLVADPTRNPSNYVLAVPVFKVGLSTTTEAERARALLGFVVCGIDVHELFSQVFKKNSAGLDLEQTHHVTFDVEDPEEKTPGSSIIYARNTKQDFLKSNFRSVSKFQFADRELILRVYSLDGFLRRSSRSLSVLILAFGLFLSVTAALLLKRNQEQAQRLLDSEIRNVSERKKQEANYRFLSDLTALLNSSLDLEKILHGCASMIVPVLGNWCQIDFIDESGALWHVADADTPERKALLTDLEKLSGGRRNTAMRNGEPFLRSEFTEDELRAMTSEPNEVALLRKLGISSAMSVPMKARSRLIGTISIFASEPERHFTENDLDFAMDVARRAALAIDNAQLYRETQRASRAKDEFLATLSHELRTPMNVILGWLEILESEKLDSESFAEALSTLSRNARMQVQLINDLLDISRIISGKIELKTKPIHLETAARAGINSLMPAARAKNISLISDFNLPRGEFIGDSDRIQQIIWNLLANAVKFTPEGGTIRVRTQASPELNSKSLQLVIEDSGQGIEPSFLPFVFDRFRQEDGSTSRLQGGLGLGLAIVRYLVELHGGSIVAESKGRGKGARFTTTFSGIENPRTNRSFTGTGSSEPVP